MSGSSYPRLRTQENALNSCIRCGYCIEHCPIFRSSRWEMDAPRGKMVLLHGLLHDEVQSTADAIERIFECLGCGQCEKACSSGVPILKVFDAARGDLLDSGRAAVGTTSQTDKALCARCLQCIRICTHEARSLREGVVTDPSKCASCGNCVDACPAGAIRLGKGYGTAPDELLHALKGFLSDEGNASAKAMVFTCSWSSAPGLQMARLPAPGNPPEHLLLVTACAGRLTAAVLLQAFHLGSWGVLVNRCPDEECTHKGSARTGQRLEAVRRALEAAGIEPARLRSVVSPKDDTKSLTAAIAAFMEEIKTFGPVFAQG